VYSSDIEWLISNKGFIITPIGLLMVDALCQQRRCLLKL
jgi:hypothetical protein